MAEKNPQAMDKWQMVILGTNILLAISGFCFCFLSIILVAFYHMDKIHYLSDGWLSLFPLLTGIQGTILILFSIIGILAAFLRNRICLIVYSFVMGLAIIPLFFTTHAAAKVTSSINTGLSLQAEKMRDHMRNVIKNNDMDSMQDFDKIQEDFGCCGFDTNAGYNDWSNSEFYTSNDNPILKRKALPESCCIKCERVCECESENFFPVDPEKRQQTFHRVGCLPIMEMIYKREVSVRLDLPYMMFVLCVAIVESIATFIAVYYVNILNRSTELKSTEYPLDSFSN